MSDGGAGRCKGCLGFKLVWGAPCGPIDLLNMAPSSKPELQQVPKQKHDPDLKVQEHSKLPVHTSDSSNPAPDGGCSRGVIHTGSCTPGAVAV